MPKAVKKEKWTEGMMVKGRNEPANIVLVAQVVANVKNLTVEEVSEAYVKLLCLCVSQHLCRLLITQVMMLIQSNEVPGQDRQKCLNWECERKNRNDHWENNNESTSYAHFGGSPM